MKVLIMPQKDMCKKKVMWLIVSLRVVGLRQRKFLGVKKVTAAATAATAATAAMAVFP